MQRLSEYFNRENQYVLMILQHTNTGAQSYINIYMYRLADQLQCWIVFAWCIHFLYLLFEFHVNHTFHFPATIFNQL